MTAGRTLLAALLAIGLCATVVHATKPARGYGEQWGGPPPEDVAGPPPEEVGGPGPQGRMRHWMSRPVSEEEERGALEFVRQFSEERARDLERQKTVFPQRYNMAIRRILWMQSRMREVAPSDSVAWQRMRRTFALEAEVEGLAARYRESTDRDEQQQTRERLLEKLRVLFDLREAEKRAEIRRMERRLEHLRLVVEQRARNRGTIVERRAERLLGERDALEW